MIKVNNITKAYDGKTALNNFSAEFSAGAYCITGASGTGKTTLLHIIMGLVKPDEGTVAGEQLKYACVFQEDRLCENLSAAKNVALICPKGFPKEKITAELKLVGLGDDLHKQTVNYSGGMKRRVAIVRALITNADVIVMDEPFKGLDDELKTGIISYIKERIKDKIFIFVTHNKDEATAFNAELIAL